MVYIGSFTLLVAFILFTICTQAWMLYLIAFLLGLGFGYINPAFQSMLINLARHDQRGTANATYFTFWDLGIGLGTAIGGAIIARFNFEWLYGICAVALILAILFYIMVSASYFEKNKLR